MKVSLNKKRKQNCIHIELDETLDIPYFRLLVKPGDVIKGLVRRSIDLSTSELPRGKEDKDFEISEVILNEAYLKGERLMLKGLKKNGSDIVIFKPKLGDIFDIYKDLDEMTLAILDQIKNYLQHRKFNFIYRSMRDLNVIHFDGRGMNLIKEYQIKNKINYKQIPMELVEIFVSHKVFKDDYQQFKNLKKDLKWVEVDDLVEDPRKVIQMKRFSAAISDNYAIKQANNLFELSRTIFDTPHCILPELIFNEVDHGCIKNIYIPEQTLCNLHQKDISKLINFIKERGKLHIFFNTLWNTYFSDAIIATY